MNGGKETGYRGWKEVGIDDYKLERVELLGKTSSTSTMTALFVSTVLKSFIISVDCLSKCWHLHGSVSC